MPHHQRVQAEQLGISRTHFPGCRIANVPPCAGKIAAYSGNWGERELQNRIPLPKMRDRKLHRDVVLVHRYLPLFLLRDQKRSRCLPGGALSARRLFRQSARRRVRRPVGRGRHLLQAHAPLRRLGFRSICSRGRESGTTRIAAFAGRPFTPPRSSPARAWRRSSSRPSAGRTISTRRCAATIPR